MSHLELPPSSIDIEQIGTDPHDDDHEISCAMQAAGVRSTNDAELLNSIDMIFKLQQRSEEIRTHLERIDRTLLSSRTVAGLTRDIVAMLERDLDLVAARILFKEDHPIASLLLWDPPEGAGIIPADFLDSEGLCGDEPFILDDLSGELSAMLFGDRAALVSSATLAVLATSTGEFGVICLGSDDPGRYRGGMNTEIIASLADKIALGLINAWDHEKRFEDAFDGLANHIAVRPFFRVALQWEFHRAWRYARPFALMGLKWHVREQETVTLEEIRQLVCRSFRSADLVCEGDDVDLWVIFPETHISGACVAAERLIETFKATFTDRVTVHAGVTEYTTAAAVASVLLQEARLAVDEACQAHTHRIVVRSVTLPQQITEEVPPTPLASWP